MNGCKEWVQIGEHGGVPSPSQPSGVQCSLVCGEKGRRRASLQESPAHPLSLGGEVCVGAVSVVWLFSYCTFF